MLRLVRGAPDSGAIEPPGPELSVEDRAKHGVLIYFDGRAYLEQRRFAEALSAFERAAELLRDNPDQSLIANLLFFVASSRARAGNRLGALAALTESIRLQADLGNWLYRARGVGRIAQIHYEAGEYAIAIARFTEAIVLFESLHETREIPFLRYSLARCLWLSWRAKEAAPMLDRALAELDAIGAADWHLTASNLRARLHHELHEHHEASRLFCSLVPRFWKAGRRRDALASFAKWIGDRVLVHLHRAPGFRPKDMTTRPPGA